MPEVEIAPTARLDCLRAFLIMVEMKGDEKGKRSEVGVCNGL